MGIKVNPSKAVVAAVSYVEPEALVSWVEVQVLAEATFPDVLAVEVVTPVDLTTLHFNKSAQDVYSGFLDSATVAALKNIADAVTMVDNADVTYEIGKAFFDYPEVVEALQYAIDKPLPNDQLFMVDGMDGNIEYQFVKVINDLQFILDAKSIDYSKDTTDQVSFTDVATTLLIFIRNFADTIDEPTDAITAKSVGKGLSETITEPETLAFDVDKALADDASVPDTPYKAFEKLVLGIAQDYADPTYFAENYVENQVVGDWLYTTNDVFTKQTTYGRNPADSLVSSDELQPFAFDKGIPDVLIANEYRETVLNKPLPGESLYAIDNMDGDIQYQVVKVVGELQLVADAQVIENSAQKSDNISTSDAGYILFQDYVSPGYFAEDYVGAAQTF